MYFTAVRRKKQLVRTILENRQCKEYNLQCMVLNITEVTDMIQELGKEKLNNSYRSLKPRPSDRVFSFDGQSVYVFNGVTPELPEAGMTEGEKTYLFSIGEDRYFLYMGKPETEGLDLIPVRELRYTPDRKFVFALYTAYHLYQWYRDNQYCGRCGKKMVHDGVERMMRCDACGNRVYPKISPAVIVAVMDRENDEIVLTKYSGRVYKRYALIAGFTEIGETAEETVAREVMEEVGLKVKNIRYYKSQPWGTDCDLLLGFTCEVDGDKTISMDENELSVAEWVKREDMDTEDDGLALTSELMRMFKENRL